MSPITRNIPPAWWPAYFNELSKQHQGWRATIVLLSREFGNQRLADGLPLLGFTFETKGSEAGDILIEVGDLPDFMIHHVDRPRRAWLVETVPGAEADVQIESEDGSITLVVLRCLPALPPGT